ncbi:uncharacterized protein EI90DRAFT_3159093 [Cantharellus anzutake]|uniref:uncharacterized protein n=1 Tax=Cantharellus anzutake TaxID=1750568 RepID=UPI00190606F2|nr:uncharacterized protein EI90DRAFT_3159093 [Cantharellus anzutake]KAF8315743.1 hypothetical protein EI90DRAFT_3159093 [Cantharellus anzutake]
MPSMNSGTFGLGFGTQQSPPPAAFPTQTSGSYTWYPKSPWSMMLPSSASAPNLMSDYGDRPITMCEVCGSSRVSRSTRAEQHRKQHLARKVEVVFEVLRAQQLTIGDFLMNIVDQDELLKKDMSPSTRTEIMCFCQGTPA